MIVHEIANVETKKDKQLVTTHPAQDAEPRRRLGRAQACRCFVTPVGSGTAGLGLLTPFARTEGEVGVQEDA